MLDLLHISFTKKTNKKQTNNRLGNFSTKSCLYLNVEVGMKLSVRMFICIYVYAGKQLPMQKLAQPKMNHKTQALE